MNDEQHTSIGFLIRSKIKFVCVFFVVCLKKIICLLLQVTGELSNNGEPMRRFMQTFVLAPQSPKKYYVHNDIFRYQDEVFHDNDSEADNLEEVVGTQ